MMTMTKLCLCLNALIFRDMDLYMTMIFLKFVTFFFIYGPIDVVYSWKIEATVNPGCDASCDFKYPNLVYIRAEDKAQSIHYFATASTALGPPSVFIATSSDPTAVANINWTRLLDYHKYDAISIKNVTSINGMSYLSIVDFRDKAGHGDLWSLINQRPTNETKDKPYMEYYLSEFEFSIKKIDPKPDEKMGLLQVLFQSDSHRKHKLVWDGGFIQMKVTVLSKPESINLPLSTENQLLPLLPGLSFRVEISFHHLTMRHSDSQLGVGVVLFSNNTLTTSADFTTQSVLLPSEFKKSDHRVSRVSEVRLNQPIGTNAPFSNWMFKDVNSDTKKSSPLPSVIFRPGPLSFLGDEKVSYQTVLMGPRVHLTKARRHRLKNCIAKALFGKRYNQQLNMTSPEKWNLAMFKVEGGNLPIGMRLQYFSFMRHYNHSTASFMKWPSLMTVKSSSQLEKEFSKFDQKSVMAWGMMMLSWLAFPFQ